MASVPEGMEPLNYQTSVLKVSIHCEGCKKKVRKVLQGLEGVYTIDIDSKLNKVTVTGIADAECLIRRLLKYGKHAELWPEKKPTSASSSGATVGDAKVKVVASAASVASLAALKTEQQVQNSENKQQAEGGKTTSPQPTETPATTPAAAAAAITSEVSASKPNIGVSKSEGGDVEAKSDKKDIEKPAAAAVEAASDASNEANDGKKKGTKAQRETSSGDEREVSDSNKAGDAAVAGVSPPPPKQFPAHAHPVYTLSYSAAQPSTSYAYYSASPAAIPSSYTYSGYPPLSAYPPENYSLDSYYGSMETPAASVGSYDMFNDENPNACNLM